MKVLISCVASALALGAFSGAMAAESSKANVYRDFTDTVAPADQDAYEAGIKAYNQCLHDHGFKYSWGVWNHETGDTYAFSAVGGPYTWADFDTMHSSDKACDTVWRKQVNPHVKGETSAFMVNQADMTYMPKDSDKQPPPAYLGVVYFYLKNGHEAHEAFTGAVKKIAAAAAKSKWSGYFETDEVDFGGADSPDYIVVLPNKSWAEVGMEPNPPLWKMMEGVYGKTEAGAIRKSLNDAIKKTSSHVDSYNADLSYTAAK